MLRLDGQWGATQSDLTKVAKALIWSDSLSLSLSSLDKDNS